jgi:putative membrane protein
MKFVFGILIGVLVVIFIIQNGEVVDVSFLFWTLTVSRAVMVMVIFLVGIITGWIGRSLGRRRRK